MTALQITTQVATIAVAVCFVLIALFFRRGRNDKVMNALYVFFAVTATLYGGLCVIEVIGNVDLTDPVYGVFRPIVFRGTQALVAVLLVLRLYRR